jgi:hypothetical protein
VNRDDKVDLTIRAYCSSEDEEEENERKKNSLFGFQVMSTEEKKLKEQMTLDMEE